MHYQHIGERWVHLIGISILILLNIMGNPIASGTGLVRGLSGYLALSGVIAAQWFGILWAVRRSRRKYPDLSQVRERLLLSFGFSIIWVAPLMGIADFSAMNLLAGGGHYGLDGWKAINFVFNAGILSFTVIGATEAVYNYHQLRKAEMEKEELQRINLLTQYDSLKQQVNPHFLFNSLNSLSSLIRIDPMQAERFVEELSHVYRYLLQSNQGELTSLRQELGFIQSFLHLLKTRFGDALQVALEVPEAMQHYKIPPLTLQLLVENAVKHNEVSSENPLRLSIAINVAGRLEVKNNLQKKLVAVPSEKVGLANIMAKYKLLGQPEVEVRETENEFIVSLPLIQEQPVG
jgi:two-component system, LytTR family, sensor kinase